MPPGLNACQIFQFVRCKPFWRAKHEIERFFTAISRRSNDRLNKNAKRTDRTKIAEWVSIRAMKISEFCVETFHLLDRCYCPGLSAVYRLPPLMQANRLIPAWFCSTGRGHTS